MIDPKIFLAYLKVWVLKRRLVDSISLFVIKILHPFGRVRLFQKCGILKIMKCPIIQSKFYVLQLLVACCMFKCVHILILIMQLVYIRGTQLEILDYYEESYGIIVRHKECCANHCVNNDLIVTSYFDFKFMIYLHDKNWIFG